MKVVVTRPRERAAELVARLGALGHEAVVCPLVETVPLGDEPVDVDGYDWVVVTSRTGAELLVDRGVPPWPSIAVIGPGTAEALRSRGHEPALVPDVSSQEGLVAAFPRPAGRVLFAGAEGARRLLVEALGADFLPLYRTVERQSGDPVDGDLVKLLYAPSQWTVTPDRKEHDRRSVYLIAKRNLRLPFMEAFDAPDAATSCSRRESSTHALQSLELLNGTLANDLAASFAERLRKEAGPDAAGDPRRRCTRR